MAASSFETYLRLDGIQGEATDSNHTNWIQVLHFSHGVAQENTGTVGAAGRRVVGKSSHGSFSIKKTLDKSSPYLNRECCSGKHIPKGVIELVATTDNKKEVILRYTLDEVVIKSIHIDAGGANQPVPSERVELEYTKIKWEYNQLDKSGRPVGNTMSEHNLATNVTA